MLAAFDAWGASSGLWGLLLSSFLSATLLPGNSEVLLVMLLQQEQWPVWQLIVVASVGNTLGSVVSLLMGRGVAEIAPQRGLTTATRWVKKYGVWSLLFSWLPLIGDILCLLAGWFRLSFWPATLFILWGKTLRYLVVALIFQGVNQIFTL
ncbi:MAG: YqaA family protein [Plesiomonas sp.]|uniref:YqaA family protein n=1 Tax=Plesiomonas sp. TaxID=2486279 RepID=UPI003F2D5957